MAQGAKNFGTRKRPAFDAISNSFLSSAAFQAYCAAKLLLGTKSADLIGLNKREFNAVNNFKGVKVQEG